MDKCTADGVIIAAKRCWWLKINTKPVRKHALDGAVFPYLITVRYSVCGAELERRKLVVWKNGIPRIDQPVTVQYDVKRPSKLLNVYSDSDPKKR